MPRLTLQTVSDRVPRGSRWAYHDTQEIKLLIALDLTSLSTPPSYGIFSIIGHVISVYAEYKARGNDNRSGWNKDNLGSVSKKPHSYQASTPHPDSVPYGPAYFAPESM